MIMQGDFGSQNLPLPPRLYPLFAVSLFALLLFPTFVLSHFRFFSYFCCFVLSLFRSYVISHFRCFTLSLFRTCVASHFHCFALVVSYFSYFVPPLFRTTTFVVSQFRCFALLFFCAFVVSHFRCFILSCFVFPSHNLFSAVPIYRVVFVTLARILGGSVDLSSWLCIHSVSNCSKTWGVQGCLWYCAL